MKQPPHEVRDTVRAHYGQVAEEGNVGCAPACCGAIDPDISLQLGYQAEDLSAVPEGANLGLGCGNPQAIAQLAEGETVLDLGSGAGFDCFLAARQVGPSGRVIGVDMTPQMISKARKNAENLETNNVEFRLGEIENLPVADGTVDAIISNCVINLSPDKSRVFADAHRVLKEGGRLAIADVVSIAEIPESLQHAAALSGCVAGAASVEDVEGMLKAVGFDQVSVTVRPESASVIRQWFPNTGAEKYVASATIEAIKGAQSCCAPSCCEAESEA